VLDTRQYRTDQPQGDGSSRRAPSLLDPQRTILGERQREWLFDGLAQSPPRGTRSRSKSRLARIDRTPGPEIGLSMDKWAGYEFERRRLLATFASARSPTRRHHRRRALQLGQRTPARSRRPGRASAASEFVGTSITSGGDGVDRPLKYARRNFVAENPFVKFFNEERGYVSCEITPQAWRTDFRTVPYVTRRGAPLQTRASFVVEAGRAQLNRA
jgi:alkaline phosphatase D